MFISHFEIVLYNICENEVLLPKICDGICHKFFQKIYLHKKRFDENPPNAATIHD